MTIKVLLGIIAAGLLFAAGRWTADGGRLAEISAEQQRLRSQVEAMGGGAAPAPTLPSAAPSAETAGLKTGIDLAVNGRPTLGPANAAVTFIEFSDFQCPFCARHVRETWPQIKAEYVDTGKIRYVFRHFPIDSLHPQAPMSAKAADCAHAQGRFWPMHDLLFGDQKDHSPTRLSAFASQARLDASAFASCMAADRPNVGQDLDQGARGGMMGTPAFFIGTSNPDGTVRVTHTVYGAKPFAAFKTAIDAALTAAGR
jgi:protein-disulfide isomerase